MPQMIFQTEWKGMDTDPSTRFRNNNTTIETRIKSIRIVLEYFIVPIYLSKS